MAARLPRQGLPAFPAAPDQNGGPTPPAGCRGHVMTAPPPPRPSGGRRRRELGVPPRRATASRGRRGLAAVCSVEWRSGGSGGGARCPGRDVGACTSRSVTASRAWCGARSERVTQDRTEAFCFVGGSSASRLGIQNQINFPREIAGVQWKPLSSRLLLWRLCRGLLGAQRRAERGGTRDGATSHHRRSGQKERRER